jgi:thiamine phosphate synthase YjbQ (UPF0047 family)
MTSVEVPYSIACVLPSLVVVDVTNEVAHTVSTADSASGIAFVAAADDGLIRVNEREDGFFRDVGALLERLVPFEAASREQLLGLLLGTRSEGIPFAERRLCLGRWQRILLVSLREGFVPEWHVTLLV